MPSRLGGRRPRGLAGRVAAAAEFVAAHQRDDGAIVALPDGTLDPWDHVECAMALDAAGRHDAATRAYEWVAREQHDDGGLWSAYRHPSPVEECRESHMATYVATGAWHRYLVTGDRDWLAGYWPAVERAAAFGMSMQCEAGEVWWACDPDGRVWPDTLVPVASSVRASLRCAERIAEVLGEPAGDTWREARERLDRSFVREHAWGETFPDDGGRFAMHWYYPVLAGIVRGAAARQRLAEGRRRFVVEWHGCRCVADRPWVTLAETAEYAIALDAAGLRDQAREVLGWQWAWQEPDGGFRMGTALDWGEWPARERPSWTAAALVLAADACYDLTPGGALFRSLGG